MYVPVSIWIATFVTFRNFTSSRLSINTKNWNSTKKPKYKIRGLTDATIKNGPPLTILTKNANLFINNINTYGSTKTYGEFPDIYFINKVKKGLLALWKKKE